MPQESSQNSFFTSPSKRGLKGLVSMKEASCTATQEGFNDNELAQRKAEEAAWRRHKATEWLREMDYVASSSLSASPSEEEFCLALRNGLILCNVLNKVNPGAVLKVVENPGLSVQCTEGAAHSAIQYFENMRNFLEAVKDMQLLTFEASDLEKGGSSNKVVDCILCLKGFYEWKLSGGIGVWRYGGAVRITSFPKKSPSSIVGSESVDESLDESESSQYEQLLEFLQLSEEFLIEETRTVNALAFLYDHFGLRLLQAYLRETNGIEDLPLNAMVIDTLLSKVVKNFSSLLVSQSTQLGLFLKKILKDDMGCLSKREFIEAISLYLNQRSSLASNDFSKFCNCGGKHDNIRQNANYYAKYTEVINTQQKQLEDHIKSLKVASTSYHKVLEENRLLYNQVQDLKGAIRVYCRVRPFLPRQSNGQSTIDYIGENGDMMIINPLKHGKDARRVFSFNKVFKTTVTQEQIYADTQPLIRSVLDGYNVCIFAYGQTGSGKTYTMSGPDLTTEETWGVNYRALGDLFYISKESYFITLTRYTLDIRSNSQMNGINVPDAFLVPVTCTQDVLDLMRIGKKNRVVGATTLNERSSRSHSVLTVHVRGRELVSNSILRGCLHLVDLAGSERVDKSEAVGERLKEAQHINRSLSALGDVISALAQKSPHIPYRNSKLTQVLQDSLGGHAKTLMFVHINPELNAFGETISTLKFAERVSSIELGAAQSNKETGEIRELKEEISNLKLALKRKEAELDQWKAGSARSTTTDSQKPRTVSPFQILKYGTGINTKHETSQRLMEDRSFESRSCSSGKQRRSRFPSTSMDKDSMPKMSFLGEEKLMSSGKGRSPSPPVRRSQSNDRGTIIKSKVKTETIDNQPILKHPFPAANKSLVTMSVVACTDNNTRMYANSQEIVKHENISETIFNLQKLNYKKVHQEHEEEQFKQVLSAVRQGGIRKNKVESKAKAKHNQLSSFTIQKPDTTSPFIPDMEFAGETNVELTPKNNSSEIENDLRLMKSTIYDALSLKKISQNFVRDFQSFESRGEPLLVSKVETEVLNGSGNHLKEGSNASTPELRRSRSTPRGKFFVGYIAEEV
ncbi:unnamed protein product [Sphenostylis stenocarpa]|uniref:Uncharacterized protein n=1 Tax=Sphenostylis stenocarpa TaxID=92480 RepID=A0AA86VZ26_9FABA|nr:unnamed protein product [Sphenostylis stenocarpa]